jgi:flavin reductase (DIM6/NTAB) family NADH-FMN oxidoreductase RutF
VIPPRVAESPASIECTLQSTVDLGESTLVLGDVRGITVQSAALVDGHPTIDALLPVSRLGHNEWGLPPPVVELDRPTKPSS